MYKKIILSLLCCFCFVNIAKAKVYHGIASWYGPGFHSKLTANGEDYDMYGLSCAHRTLPFNTLIEVYNKQNKRKCIVRVNDRGPVSPSFIMDLSYGGAMAINSRDTGKAKVRLTLVGNEQGVYDNTKKFYVFLDDTIILPKNIQYKNFSDDEQEYFRNIAGGVEIYKLTQRHIKRLYQANIYNAANLLVSINKSVCIGPYKDFHTAEKIYHSVATQYPHASIWLESTNKAKRLVLK